MSLQSMDISKPKTKRAGMGVWLIRVAYAALALSAAMDLFASPKEELILSMYVSIASRFLAAVVIFYAERLVHKGFQLKACCQ